MRRRSTSSSTGATTPTVQTTLHTLEPPELPERLSPGQAAQLFELLEYLHIRIRDLLASVKIKADAERVTLEARQWQNLLDLQSRLAGYLRAIGRPTGRLSQVARPRLLIKSRPQHRRLSGDKNPAGFPTLGRHWRISHRIEIDTEAKWNKTRSPFSTRSAEHARPSESL